MKRKGKWTRTSLEFTEQHLSWLRLLAANEDLSGAAWIRRQIKIAAQLAKLPGAIKKARVSDASIRKLAP